MLDLLPWVFLFFVPAVTMRSLAEDIRGGQLEVVLSQPLTELELLLGKYLASVLFLWIALALTLPIPLALAFGAAMPWPTVAAQYVGAGLLAAGFAGIGTWASSLSRSQITAFILGAAVMFLLILVGLNPLLVGLPAALAAVAARIGVLAHFDSIGRGVIDLRDVIYFLSLAGIFLALAYGALLGRKLAPARGARRRLVLGVGLLAASLVVVNLLGGYIGGRLDLSPGKAYTLSPATRRVLGNLDDLVTIKVFASAELPTEVALMKRDVDDMLRDVRAAGHDRVRIIERDPSSDDAARKDAQSLGIEPVQFNVIGQSELQVKQGYFGLALQHGSQTETVPFVDRTDDLEYRLVSSIRNLTRAHKPAIGFVTQPATEQGNSYSALQEQLGKAYDVRPLALTDSTQLDTAVAAVVLAGAPDSVPAAQLARLQRYVDGGGSVLVLAGGMAISPQEPVATPRLVPWNALLQRFGVSIRSDMAYDLVANEAVPLPERLRAGPAGLSLLHPGGEHPPVDHQSGPRRGRHDVGEHHRHRQGGARDDHAAAAHQRVVGHAHGRDVDRSTKRLPADAARPPPARGRGGAQGCPQGCQERAGGRHRQHRLRHRPVRARRSGEPCSRAQRDRLARAG